VRADLVNGDGMIVSMTLGAFGVMRREGCKGTIVTSTAMQEE
jgi:hypothetical protein